MSSLKALCIALIESSGSAIFCSPCSFNWFFYLLETYSFLQINFRKHVLL
jgi:hypothetical protein